jgi:uncharacterized phage-associated protein
MGSSPYSAMTISKWFAAWATADEADLSNLKLQKILYFAQGHHLGRFGSELFTDDLQAWAHGPVVPAVYRKFKIFKSGDIELPEDDTFDWADVDSTTTQFLIEMWNVYGQFGAWRLRNMTHEEGPWSVHFRADEDHIVIPKSELQLHFANR